MKTFVHAVANLFFFFFFFFNTKLCLRSAVYCIEKIIIQSAFVKLLKNYENMSAKLSFDIHLSDEACGSFDRNEQFSTVFLFDDILNKKGSDESIALARCCSTFNCNAGASSSSDPKLWKKFLSTVDARASSLFNHNGVLFRPR